jgi:hypothetical protein
MSRWSLGLALGLLAASGAEAQEDPWRPVASAARAVSPAGRLGRPQPLDGAPESPRRLVRAQAPDFPPPPPAPPPGWSQPPAGQFQVPPGGQLQPVPAGPFPPPAAPAPGGFDERYACGVNHKRTTRSGVGDALGFGGGQEMFRSDDDFCAMISPVTEPFLAEDPRALTEIKPVFIYQRTPNLDGNGRGNVAFFGAQGRVAFTERLSLVISKFGFTFLDPPGTLGGDNEVGFSEVWLGPKFTFLRNPDSGTVMAAGLTFQIPLGSGSVYQDTGDLSIAPYFSFGQTFGKTAWGTFNFMNTTGYAFRTDNTRTPYLYSTFHLSFDVADQHRIFPLVELNFVHYTRNGDERYLSFEGKDLINFGSRGIAGKSDLSLALGARYKFSEQFQIGGAFEVSLLSHDDLCDWRFTLDFIFRF